MSARLVDASNQSSSRWDFTDEQKQSRPRLSRQAPTERSSASLRRYRSGHQPVERRAGTVSKSGNLEPAERTFPEAQSQRRAAGAEMGNERGELRFVSDQENALRGRPDRSYMPYQLAHVAFGREVRDPRKFPPQSERVSDCLGSLPRSRQLAGQNDLRDDVPASHPPP